ncbi:MAG: cupin domain-containing protein [Isosphaeraceae bacterium]
MPRYLMRSRLATTFLTLLVLALAAGWAMRERALARERAAMIASRTINLDQLKMEVYEHEGKAVGHMGLYVQGETPGCASLVTGRFIIDPGKSPHPPHVHEDEEILIVEAGHGEMILNGKATKVGPGSVLYATPNVPHGINNTSAEPLTFTFVKWIPRGGSHGK